MSAGGAAIPTNSSGGPYPAQTLGTESDTEPSAGAGAGPRSSLMSAGGAAIPTNRSGPGANGLAAAPFLGTASNVGDGVHLWFGVGLWLWAVGCLIGV